MFDLFSLACNSFSSPLASVLHSFSRSFAFVFLLFSHLFLAWFFICFLLVFAPVSLVFFSVFSMFSHLLSTRFSSVFLCFPYVLECFHICFQQLFSFHCTGARYAQCLTRTRSKATLQDRSNHWEGWPIWHSLTLSARSEEAACNHWEGWHLWRWGSEQACST